MAVDRAAMTSRRTAQGRHTAVPARPARTQVGRPGNGVPPASYDALVVGRFLLFPARSLPESLRDRAVPLFAVDLQATETPEMYGEQLAWPLDAGDMEILRLLASGQSTRQIAARTGVSMRTVQRQVARLRRRLRVTDAADLRRYLRDRGFRFAG